MNLCLDKEFLDNTKFFVWKKVDILRVSLKGGPMGRPYLGTEDKD